MTRICQKFVAFFLLTSAFGITAPRARHKHVDPRLFRPSADAALRQTEVIDACGLIRIRDDRELSDMVAEGVLVPLTGVRIDPRLPANRRYVLPDTRVLISALSAEFNERFDASLTVTSAVRPESVQKKLRRWNRNAAPVTGEHASSHMTGATVDIARKDMTPEENRFLEGLLLPLVLDNRVIVIEERGQMCYHLFVIPRNE